MWFLSSHPFMWWIVYIDLCMLKHTGIFVMKLTWSRWIIFFSFYFLHVSCFLKCIIEKFCIYVNQRYWPKFFFFVGSLCAFSVGKSEPHKKFLRCFLFILWTILRNIDVGSLKVCYNAVLNPSGPVFFF